MRGGVRECVAAALRREVTDWAAGGGGAPRVGSLLALALPLLLLPSGTLLCSLQRWVTYSPSALLSSPTSSLHKSSTVHTGESRGLALILTHTHPPHSASSL